MLTEQLKQHTSEVHTELEQLLLSHIHAIDCAERYASVLALMYGYYSALESKLEQFADELPQYHQRRKSQAILEDLTNLGLDRKSLTKCTNLPNVSSIGQALGVMYVLEGSTLGGKYISRQILKQQPSLHGCTTFFDGYGEATGSMWIKFKQHFHEAISESEYPEARAAAAETFLKFKLWIEANEPA